MPGMRCFKLSTTDLEVYLTVAMKLLLYVLMGFSLSCNAFINYKSERARICTTNYAKRTICGENVVSCRPFELKSPKNFGFVGSYKSFNLIPKFAVPEIAFIGRSNVGKSSLLNCLTGAHKAVAVTGKTPGTTQSVNIFQCSDKSGPICTFADLPGFGFAKVSRLQQDEISLLLKDYFSARGSLKLVMLLVDSRRDPSQADLETFKFLVERAVPVVVVVTKVDKLSKVELFAACSNFQRMFAKAIPTDDIETEGGWEQVATPSAGTFDDAQRRAGSDSLPVVLFSAVTGFGQGDLWKVIRDNLIAP